MVETINQKIVKARKEHKCSWCHGIIKVGEEYENSTLKTPDHGIYVWKNHMRCHELVDGLDMHMHGWDGVCDDVFADCVQEYIQENNWFRDDVDVKVEGSLYKDEKLEDWMDEQDWGSTAIKAYEIYKEKENEPKVSREEVFKMIRERDLKLGHVSLMPDGSMQAGFTTIYSSTWTEEIEYIGKYTGHNYEIKKVDKEEDGVEFVVTFSDHDGIIGSGDTVEEALSMAKEALDMWLQVRKEDGE